MDNARAYIEKTVLLLGESSTYITYFRRYNIFAALNCPAPQSKEMLREEADLLQWYDRNLIWKKFSKHFVASAKSQRAREKSLLENSFRSTEEIRNCSSTDLGNQNKMMETISQQLEEAVNSKVKINKKETLFNMSLPPKIPLDDLRNVHPWVHILFSASAEGKLKHFWKYGWFLQKTEKL